MSDNEHVLDIERGTITKDQYAYLLNRLRGDRVAQRKLGNKNFSYLEAWDVRAHLSRIFGFGNWDGEVTEAKLLGTYNYESRGQQPVPMVEVMWQVTFRLVIRDPQGREVARYTETAVGSATKGADGAGLGDIHDNAVKSGTSDALKRCAINLGTQFGLSLYDNGNLNDVVRRTLVRPEGTPDPDAPSQEAQEALRDRLGASPKVTPTEEPAGREGAVSEVLSDAEQPGSGGEQG
jgi:recombination DNA repair RAD52 pathway protein